MTHARMSSDATEIYRDLHRPKEALSWNDQAAGVQPGVFTRSVGIRFAVLGTVHLERGELDQGLALGHQAIGILSQVQSTRAADYVREFTPALTPWKGEGRVEDFLHRVRTDLAAAS